jgi:hypothetical protein
VVKVRDSVVDEEVGEAVVEVEDEVVVGLAAAMLLGLMMIRGRRYRGRGKSRVKDRERIIIGEISGLRRWPGVGCRDNGTVYTKPNPSLNA